MHLIYDIEWDSTLNWLIGNAKIIASHTTMTRDDIQILSSSWGNYQASINNAAVGAGVLREAGYNEYWKANNIYDLAGNVGEWTQERFIYPDGEFRSARAHGYGAGNDLACAAYRLDGAAGNGYADRRFPHKFLHITNQARKLTGFLAFSIPPNVTFYANLSYNVL